MTTIFYELMDPDTAYGGTHPAITLLDGASNTVYQQVYIPIQVSAPPPFTVKVLLIPGATGDLSWGVLTNWGRVCADAFAGEGSDSIAQNETTVTAGKIECIDITEAFTGIVAGSLAGVAFTRYGASGSDTVNANCYYLGVQFEYT